MNTELDEEDVNINEQTIRAPKQHKNSSSASEDDGPAYHVCDNEPFYDAGSSLDDQRNNT